MSSIQESLEALKKDASANGYDPDRVIIPRQTGRGRAGGRGGAAVSAAASHPDWVLSGVV